MQQPVHIEFELKAKHIIAYQFRNLYSNMLVVVLTLIGLANLLVMLAQAVQHGAEAWHTFKPVQYMFVFMALFVPLYTYMSARRVAASPAIGSRKSYTFAEERIEFAAGGESAILEWAQIRRADRTASLLLLYVTSRAAHLIPVDGSANSGQWKQIDEWMSRKVRPAGAWSLPWLRRTVYAAVFAASLIVVYMNTAH